MDEFTARHAKSPPFFNWKVETTYDPEEESIIQKITNDYSAKMVKYVMKLRDQQVREALVRLGWTPPPDPPNELDPPCDGG